MDCILPGHAVRTFSHAVGCLCRIGKELYMDFDPIDGLYLRALNDAKSAFASFHFEPSYFERCTAPLSQNQKRVAESAMGKRNVGNGRITTNTSRSSSLSRQRDLSRKKRNRGGRGRYDEKDHDDENDNDGKDNEYDNRLIGNDERHSIRVPIKAVHALLRSRKGVRSLRIRSIGAREKREDDNTEENGTQSSISDHEGEEDAAAAGSVMQLCLEFRMESAHGALMRIVHRIGVSECDSVTAVAPTDNCSEMVCIPTVFGRILDPLKMTAEVALTIRDDIKVVTASSFHHADAAAAAVSSSAKNSALLSAVASSVLKTETSMGCDEFDEYSWRDDRNCTSDDDDENYESGDVKAPPGSNSEVSLVFSIKEVKAMLQFCSQGTTSDEDMRVVISFEWGGRPIIFESEGEGFSVTLVMATLDHALLRSANRGVQNDGSRTGG